MNWIHQAGTMDLLQFVMESKGYMEKLLTYLIEEGKKSGIKTILNSADMKAIPLYERVGFHTSSTIMYIDL